MNLSLRLFAALLLVLPIATARAEILPAPIQVSPHAVAWIGPYEGPSRENQGFRMNLGVAALPVPAAPDRLPGAGESADLAVKNGTDIESAKWGLDASAWKSLVDFNELNGRNAYRAYLESEAEGFWVETTS